MVKHTAYTNGAIRNTDGKLIAFYDAQTHHLLIDGVLRTFFAENIEIAMDMVATHYDKK